MQPALIWKPRVWADKEKARTFLSHQSAPIAATAAKAELNSAAKLIQDFETPKVSEGVVEDYNDWHGKVDNVRTLLYLVKWII